MGYIVGGWSLALALAVCAPAAAEELCGEEFASHDALEAVIKAKPGVKVLGSDASVASYSDPATNFIWNFATSENAAFPSVACRHLVEVDGAYSVATEISCGAEKAACDRLADSYNELDRKMRESVEKGRQH
jgi:hypothetical protein